MTTKADQIRALYATGRLSTSEIAERVGCRVEYVRVCARQRKNGEVSEIDRRYTTSPLGKMTRQRREDECESAARRAYYAALEQTADMKAANAAARRASAAARDRGASSYEVQLIAMRVRARVRSHTGCKVRAREAARQTRLQLQAFHVKNQENQHGQQAEA
jgi:hypothetical protein